MLYVGVDAHKATSQVTVMNESGKIIKRKSIATSRADVREALGLFRQPMKAVVEASYCWGPIYDWLDELTEDVVLAHPGKVKAIAEARIKTDKIDSEILAHLLRTDLIPQAYAPSKDIDKRFYGRDGMTISAPACWSSGCILYASSEFSS